MEIPRGLNLTGSVTSPRGRDLVATQSFGPGDLIARFDGPSIALPDTPTLHLTCSYCLRIDVDVKACTGCQGAYYCSKPCQRADWALAHKRECKAFKKVRAEGGHGRLLPTPVRALMQMLVRPDLATARTELGKLVEGWDRNDAPEDYDDMKLQAMAALKYLELEMTPARLGEALAVLFMLKINSFNRKDEDVGDTGIFLHPALSMINHSCLPNAFVQFDGRQAILRANKAIKEGEIVDISYIDCNLHKSNRIKALKERWRFDCLCSRCENDLDVYQTAWAYPHLDLNSISLNPDFTPSSPKPSTTVASIEAQVEEIYSACSTPLSTAAADSPSQYAAALRQRWQLCQPLCAAGLYAVEPVPQTLGQATIHLGEQREDYPSSLAVSCFIALRCDPVKSPMPFGGARIKGLQLLANLLSNTAPLSGRRASSFDGSLRGRIVRALSNMDQATIAQAVLAIAVHWAPRAHSEEWQIYHEAKEQLQDIEGLRGRDKEKRLIQRWITDQTDQEAALFFDYAVLKPVQELAGFALEIMDTEFGSNRALLGHK
ncbi:hypothetical protein PFICI_01791 [Pestalotiopsis fici W106-1]|uniref:Uncharacterized protein n=1 Tax=Pestalotiopsis fici (strain W106-1 / CGMCC3.15140) TaxID=1229662 RepID=W3XPH5_PESFW|nr:uncharacterized protein PFICI_01791 [Pestalotiopsis fici W106-1]ETS87963.1 hypothetical protein PFICI_01791 [Pestalotiopsis fici W106-1]